MNRKFLHAAFLLDGAVPPALAQSGPYPYPAAPGYPVAPGYPQPGPPPYPPVPAPRVEVVPAPPPGVYVWQPGHWAWGGRGYVWVEGRYVPRHPRHGAYAPGRWVWNGGAWVWAPAHWR